MWQVGSSTIKRKDGLSCRSKGDKVFILSALVMLSSFSRSKIAGYAAKELVLCCLLHVSAHFEADLGGRGGREEFARSSLVRPWVGLVGGGGLVGVTSGGGTWPVLTFSHIISSSSPAAVAGMCGACGAGGVDVSSAVLYAARPWSIFMIFMSSST